MLRQVVRTASVAAVRRNATKLATKPRKVALLQGTAISRPWMARRHFAASAAPAEVKEIINKNDLKALMKEKTEKYTLIDVREPHETDAGRIPTSVVVPLGMFFDTFGNPSKFEAMFGFPRPDPESRVIFYCRSGARSHMAMEFARGLGFKRAQSYKGSFNEWSSTESEIVH